MSKDFSYANAYIHFFPAVAPDPNWRDKYTYTLVESMEQLRSIMPEEPVLVGFDLETSGLNPEVDFIVGVCLCFDGKIGYYIPINHAMGQKLQEAFPDQQFDSVATIQTFLSLAADEEIKTKLLEIGAGQVPIPNLGQPALDIVYQMLQRAKEVAVFNLKFDFRFMEYAGYPMNGIEYHDVNVGMFLADTNVKFPSLKKSEVHWLGWDAQKFEDALGGATNFYEVSPRDATFYAATDALGTWHLTPISKKFCQESGQSGKIDNKFLYPQMKEEESLTPLDIPLIDTIKEETNTRMTALLAEMWGMYGSEFKPMAPKDVGKVLLSFGLDTGSVTKTGQMSTAEADLASIRDKHPIIPIIEEFKKLKKVDSSYLIPMKTEAEKKGGYIRSSYQNYSAPTCRLAGGKDAKNSFFSAFNIHAVPKPKPLDYYCKYTGSTAPDAILGWEFSPDPAFSDMKIEGFEQKGNIRKAFIPDTTDEHYWVSMDFSGQEIRLAALMSHEPIWIKALQNDEDIHKVTAEMMWGAENYDKGKRRRAKEVNFGALYGQGAWGFAQKWGIDKDEAQDILDKFWDALPTLKKFQADLQAQANKLGTVYNFFGRPRRVKWFINYEHPNKSDPSAQRATNSMRAFGRRTVVNTVIQSAGADILKLAMMFVYRDFFAKDEYKHDVAFLNTVHDEINFRVKKDRTEEIVPLLYKTMKINHPTWEISMEVGVSLGNSWGYQFDFKVKEDGTLEPKYEKVEQYVPKESDYGHIVHVEKEDPVGSAQDDFVQTRRVFQGEDLLAEV